MQLCLFEDIYYERLEPLIFSRTTYDLICGINSLRAKILRAYPGIPYSIHCRQYLEPMVKSRNASLRVNHIEDDACLFINGRIVAPENLAEIIPLEDSENKVYLTGDTIAAVRVSGSKLEQIKANLFDLFSLADFDGIPIERVDVPHIDYIWDLVTYNRQEFINDFNYHAREKKRRMLGTVLDGAHIICGENVFIDEGAVVMPGVVIDASAGPVYLDKQARIAPNSVLENAVYIGESTQVKACARIHDNVSVGKVCKVGGEVEDSIILPYSNKQHNGFLGHAYVGSWVNIGADTNNSDLKNNYGNVKVYVNGEVVDSGLQFLGCIIGDHSKTAINTMLNTGTIIGYSCNIFDGGFPAKYLPSFSWGGGKSVTTYDLERSIETAKRAMLRRDHTMAEFEEKLFRKIFDITKKERRKRGYPF
jgi:UDP-N-acetylglucosamine diphosphorylase / glucose-1-phosphate thymidylyltransferase / UDP-N-acetylgalactosamine diphosphorylase / glucosamine-1-phosphate N-acetyltransferase / galactosamine-1-phosphate N-acetyltransferase